MVTVENTLLEMHSIEGPTRLPHERRHLDADKRRQGPMSDRRRRNSDGRVRGRRYLNVQTPVPAKDARWPDSDGWRSAPFDPFPPFALTSTQWRLRRHDGRSCPQYRRRSQHLSPISASGPTRTVTRTARRSYRCVVSAPPAWSERMQKNCVRIEQRIRVLLQQLTNVDQYAFSIVQIK